MVGWWAGVGEVDKPTSVRGALLSAQDLWVSQLRRLLRDRLEEGRPCWPRQTLLSSCCFGVANPCGARRPSHGLEGKRESVGARPRIANTVFRSQWA